MMPRSSRMLCSSSTTRTLMSGMSGQGECEDAAGAGSALHIDVAAVVLHHAVDERQAEAAAVELGGVEGLEDVPEVDVGDAFPRVGDADQQAPGGGDHGDTELTALGHRLQRIEAEIPDHLPELLP